MRLPNEVIASRLLGKCVPEPNSGCWLWLAAQVGADSYGQMWDGERSQLAHRLSYQVWVGALDPSKLILHSCDNPYCINPDHLREGTQVDNVADMLARDRNAVGDRHPKSVLKEADVSRIRASALPHRVIARGYGVDESTVRALRGGETWKRVSPALRPDPVRGK